MLPAPSPGQVLGVASTSASSPAPPAPLREPQLLLVLAGVVGSGKSTLAHALAANLPHWARVNQDDLGDRRACEDMVKMYLSQGLNVVVDRQNFDEGQRRTWLEMGTQFPGVSVRGLVMGTTPSECRQRLQIRTNHPTIGDPQLAAELLDKFLSLWSEPKLEEGFDYLLTLPSLPPSPLLDATLLASLLVSLSQSPFNPLGAQQRQPRPRASQGWRSPQSGYAPPRGAQGSSRGGNSWRGTPQSSQGGGAPRGDWGGGAPHAWGGGGRSLEDAPPGNP